MRVKRYIVDTLPDAVSIIRTEMGTDAVILETKEIKVGGFLGMFRKKKIEVMAAVEPSAQKKEKKTSKLNNDQVDYVVEQILKASQRGKEQPKLEEESDQQLQPTNAPIGNTNGQASFAARLYGTNGKNSEGDTVVQVATDANVLDNVSSNNNDLSSVSAMKEKHNQLEVQHNSHASSFSNTEQFIVNELKNLRLEMHKLSNHQTNNRSLSAAIESVKKRLQEQEIIDNWVELICDELIDYEIQQNEILQPDAVWEFVKNKFMEWLSPYSEAAIANETRIVQFVGPTGVGKTTTIAKLSANFSIKEGKKLGLITADTYRIAAVEQLRTYANILNLPLEVVFSPMDLQRAYQQLEHVQLILMDTAGRNFKNDIHVSEVNSLIQTSAHSEAILVLSLTSRTNDMNVVAEKFSKFGVRKIVFTKLDEANSYGLIFNMVMTYGLQPLYVTSGQNVPDDIEAFSVSKFVELLLGEPQYA